MTIVTHTATLAALTEASITGNGVFDVLMKANKAHLDEQFKEGRIRGPEYATVYLGSLEAVLNASLQFLLQKDKIEAECELAQAQRDLAVQQTANAVIEGTVLTAQKCLLQAQYDGTLATTLKTQQETTLLSWKVTTEKAQTTSVGVDADSVVGKQKILYQAQSDGFIRDAEQKATKIMVDTWNARRMTDDATVADSTNLLNDASIGRAVTKLLSGIAA